MKALEAWIDASVAETFVNHSPTFDVPTDREGLKEMFSKLLELYPDIMITIEDMAVEKDIFCFRMSIRGIVADKGLVSIAMVKLADGKFVERWALTESVAPA